MISEVRRARASRVSAWTSQPSCSQAISARCSPGLSATYESVSAAAGGPASQSRVLLGLPNDGAETPKLIPRGTGWTDADGLHCGGSWAQLVVLDRRSPDLPHGVSRSRCR